MTTAKPAAADYDADRLVALGFPKWKADVVVYHANCVDGFTCYWILERELPYAFDAIPMTHGDPFPFERCVNKNVLFVDFSLKPADMERLIEGFARTVVILDHHEGAEEALKPYAVAGTRRPEIMIGPSRGRCVARFDMNKCGAILTYEWLWNQEFPMTGTSANVAWERRMLRYIDARDRWQKEFSTRLDEVSAYIGSWDMTLDNWDQLELVMRSNFSFAAMAGTAILRYKANLVKSLCDLAQFTVIDGSRVPVVNAPYRLASDVGHELLQRYPEADFAASVVVDPVSGERNFSLRGEDGRRSAREVAVRFGGNGHRNACGFRVGPMQSLE